MYVYMHISRLQKVLDEILSMQIGLDCIRHLCKKHLLQHISAVSAIFCSRKAREDLGFESPAALKVGQ